MTITEPNSTVPAAPYRKRPTFDGDAPKHAAGILFVSPDGNVLLLKRSDAETNYAGHWALPGGGVEDGETPWRGAVREVEEELGGPGADAIFGAWFTGKKPRGIDRRISPNGIVFHTFALPVDEEFQPTLNGEHSEHQWSTLGDLPDPMHPAVLATLRERLGLEAATGAEDCTAIAADFVEWLNEKDTTDLKHDPEIKDVQIKLAPDGLNADAVARGAMDTVLAFDKETVRDFDRVGRMHVKEANICKECVSPYRGNEIPGWRELGLNPEQIYQLYRPGDELERALKSANGIPVLRVHKQTSAEDHKFWDTVGATGTSAVWARPYIKNALSVWPGEDVEGVTSGRKRELSPGYHYKPVMEPGIFVDPETGEKKPYDGRMTDLEFNHLALVEDGRQNTDSKDILIGDSSVEMKWAAVEGAILSAGR